MPKLPGQTCLEEEKSAALSILRETQSLAETARQTGIGRVTLAKWRKDEGIELKSKCGTRYSDEFVASVVALVRSGGLLTQTANDNHITCDTLLKWCKWAGVKPKRPAKIKSLKSPGKPGPPRGRYTEKTLHALDLLKNGLTQAAVARELGCSHQWIHQIVKREVTEP